MILVDFGFLFGLLLLFLRGLPPFSLNGLLDLVDFALGNVLHSITFLHLQRNFFLLLLVLLDGLLDVDYFLLLVEVFSFHRLLYLLRWLRTGDGRQLDAASEVVFWADLIKFLFEPDLLRLKLCKFGLFFSEEFFLFALLVLVFLELFFQSLVLGLGDT